MIKKDGVSWRACSDGREGNQFVVVRHAIGEDIRTQLHYLRGSRFYCNIDLKEAYTQLRYDDVNGLYVLFINGRFYRQRRLGMGITNAEFFLQVLISDIFNFHGIGFDCVLHTADNFLVHAPTELECAERFVQLMDILEYYGLIISPKCELLVQRTEYMGLIIEGDSWCKCPRLIKDFIDLSRTKTLGDIDTALNRLTFVCDNIDGFAAIAQDLRKFSFHGRPRDSVRGRTPSTSRDRDRR